MSNSYSSTESGQLQHMVQRPAELPEVALVLRSVEGTGKNAFVDYVGKLVGRHFKTLSNMDELTGQFNSHLADALLVFANEAVWGGDKRRQGPLKALITDDSCKLETKGKDAVFVRNYKRIIAASNADHPVPVDRGDRRYALFDVARSRKEDYAFFEAVIVERGGAGPSALMYDLLHEDLTDWNPRNRPESTRPVELQQRSASPIQSWLQDALFEGAIVFEGTVTEPGGDGSIRSHRDRVVHPWDGEVPKDDLYDAYVQACRRTHARPDGNALFFNALADRERGYGVLVPNAERKLRISGETRKRVVLVRPLAESSRCVQRAYRARPDDLGRRGAWPAGTGARTAVLRSRDSARRSVTSGAQLFSKEVTMSRCCVDASNGPVRDNGFGPRTQV